MLYGLTVLAYVDVDELPVPVVVAPVSAVTWQETDTLSDTERGAGGFGSTGVTK